MSLGQKFESQMKEYTDAETGVKVKRITSGKYNSSHIYFTNNSLYDNNSKLIILSDRGESQNFYSVDLNTYEFTQVTDLPKKEFPAHYSLYEGIVDAIGGYVYFTKGRDLMRVDLRTYEEKKIYEIPEGFARHVISCMNGGEYVYTSIYRVADMPPASERGLRAPRPLSRIIKIKNDGSESKVIREEDYWIAHVNVSPTDENKITYCHEGGWRLVDNRIWGMDVNTGKVWKICDNIPCKSADGSTSSYAIGHEYWYADGKRIGFHGYGANRIIGHINFDGSGLVYAPFEYNTGHTFSLDEKLIVGDGDRSGRYIRVWKYDGENYSEPRVLCRHDSSWKTQSSHVHPRVFPDGKHVLFTSDRDGYEQVYISELPEFESLLPLERVSKI